MGHFKVGKLVGELPHPRMAQQALGKHALKRKTLVSLLGFSVNKIQTDGRHVFVVVLAIPDNNLIIKKSINMVIFPVK